MTEGINPALARFQDAAKENNLVGLVFDEFSCTGNFKLAAAYSFTGMLCAHLTGFRDGGRMMEKYLIAKEIEQFDTNCAKEIEGLGENPKKADIAAIKKHYDDAKAAKIAENKENGIEQGGFVDMLVSIGKRTVCAAGYALLTLASVVEVVFRGTLLLAAYIAKVATPNCLNKSGWTDKFLAHASYGAAATLASLVSNTVSFFNNFFDKPIQMNVVEQAESLVNTLESSPASFIPFGLSENDFKEESSGRKFGAAVDAAVEQLNKGTKLQDLPPVKKFADGLSKFAN